MTSKALNYFLEISKYPRPSKDESKVRDFLVSWADWKWFKNKTDMAWNLIIYIPATQDKLGSESVILQSHMDMVCVKTSDSNHDFLNDPIEIIEENWFLKAKDTSLWADDWAWIALALSAAGFESHPKLELVFTTDEETWLSWALGFDFSLVSSKNIINLDSESDDEICISSAWWARLNINKSLGRQIAKFPQYKIDFFWMRWWHSWVEIDKNTWNAIHLMLTFLSELEIQYELVNISWWDADNAIPKSVLITLGVENIDLLEKELILFIEKSKKIFDCPSLSYKIEKLDKQDEVIKDSKNLFKTITNIKTWIYSFSSKIEWLVQTSTNLWIINIKEDKIVITYAARSSINFELDDLIYETKNNYESNWFDFIVSSRYPGWQDDPEWALVKISSDEFEKIKSKKPNIIAIHAWLECWALVSWLWDWAHAISIWPNMFDVHTVNEKVEIESIYRMEVILENILRRF